MRGWGGGTKIAGREVSSAHEEGGGGGGESAPPRGRARSISTAPWGAHAHFPGVGPTGGLLLARASGKREMGS